VYTCISQDVSATHVPVGAAEYFHRNIDLKPSAWTELLMHNAMNVKTQFTGSSH
jgi:hypothetical protein